MEQPIPAQKAPYEFEIEKDRKYAWCACGRSRTQPLCDGSHVAVGLLPVVFRAEETKTVWLCGCKQTKDKPYCDGTHNTL
jgi:CDGSH-type Zn-finger protein